jgi:hypothetical protein
VGTFHEGKSELHGITVVVDTVSSKVYIGRCWDMDDREIVLVDADEHEEGGGGRSKEEFVREAARVGVWKKHDRLTVPRSQVAWIRPLGEFVAS